MEIASLCFIVVLVIIVLVLMIYNYSVHKKIETFTNLNQRVTNLNVLQDFINTLGDDLTIEEKLDRINDILISKYSIKYSTIVIFNGAEYEIKASNVEEKHWDTLKNLQSDPVFSDSIKTAIPKYVTVENESEKLPYQKMELGRAKCAMFFPLYIENVYIGYWIIEGSHPHEFDKLDTTILEVVRKNIITVFKTIRNQETIENMVRDDKFSGLKSVEYLYGVGRKTIDQNTTSAICLYKIVNLPAINNIAGREVGNNVITSVSNFVKNNLASSYLFVRYMGPKFVIVFSGVDNEGAYNFMESLKAKIEKMSIEYSDNDENGNKVIKTVSPKIKVVVSTYYKGTSLDGALRKIEEFVDKSDDNNLSMV